MNEVFYIKFLTNLYFTLLYFDFVFKISTAVSPAQTIVKNHEHETKRFSTFEIYRLRHSETNKKVLDSRIMFSAEHVQNSQSTIYLKSHGCVHGYQHEVSLIKGLFRPDASARNDGVIHNALDLEHMLVNRSIQTGRVA